MSLHAYTRSPEFTASAPEYRTALSKRLRKLDETGAPVVLSLKHLSLLSGVGFSSLQRIVSRKREHTYRTFAIRKRSGGKRWISVPCASLLRVQRWVQDCVLSSKAAQQLVSAQSKAFSPGDNIVANAAGHCSASMIVKVDIENFFTSINEVSVYKVFRRLGYPALVSFELARICTRVVSDKRLGPPPPYARKHWKSQSKYAFYSFRFLGHLPQGAPTSPMLANLVCRSLDEQLEALAKKFDAHFTRYADDLTFSLDTKNREIGKELVQKIGAVLRDHGLAPRAAKTVISGPGARKIVTGLVVNGLKPSLPKEIKARIEVPLYFIEKYGLINHCERSGFCSPISYLNHIFGLVRYASMVDPVKGASWLAKIRKAVEKDILLLEPLRPLLSKFR